MAEIPIVELQLDDKDLARLPGVLANRAERGIKRTALLTEARAVRYAPVARFGGKKKGGKKKGGKKKGGKKKGGNLKNSGTTEFSGSGYATVAKIKFTAPYAIYVHEGTGIFGPKQRPYVVEAKNKKALYWRGAAHPFKKVTIRGMKARPFLKQASEEEFPKLRERLFE